MTKNTLQAVKKFWEENPLYLGESSFEAGSHEFFEEHTAVVLEDCFAGEVDQRIFPAQAECSSYPVLDAGCGIGFWLEQFVSRGFRDITGVDISRSALALARMRMTGSNIKPELVEGNLEDLPFLDGSFAHVNCQGVIHHTPYPMAALSEIARVLRTGGTASISVYHDGILLKLFRLLRPLFGLAGKLGGGLKGRGRESILSAESAEELVRMYDGKDNPIGISYSQRDFKEALGRYFEVDEMYVHFFPRRAFPWVPRSWHGVLDRHFGLMVYASVSKVEKLESSGP
mgnify:CR=1 FL=1